MDQHGAWAKRTGDEPKGVLPRSTVRGTAREVWPQHSCLGRFDGTGFREAHLMQCCGYGRNAECGGLGGLGGASVVVRPASARTIAVGSCDRSPWATLVGAPVGYVPCLEISGTGRCGQCEAPGKRRARGWFRPCRGGAGCRLRTTSRPSHLSPVSGRRLGPGHTPVEQHSSTVV